MSKLTELCLNKQEEFNVLHLGDSHLQAGYYSNEIRQYFQNYFIDDSLANLGLIFPYTVAKTNNPQNYRIRHTGKWQSTKATTKKKDINTGITGINLYTNDTSATLSIYLNKYYPIKNYAFDHSKIFCNYPDSTYNVYFSPKAHIQKTNSALEVEFNSLTDSIKIHIEKSNLKDTSHFELSGLTLSNTTNSFSYHATGVNGAKAESYLNCQLFDEQLQSLSPDWVIISLGTNEAYSENYTPEEFQKNLTSLIQSIRNNTDSCWILLSTPGDALHGGKTLNPNNQLVRQDIVEVANKVNCSYWDFYTIMGGERSIDLWYSSELTAKDKLHLNKKGYLLKANLFFDAFLNSFQPFFRSKIHKE
ncbi:MAG: GDSL-type esterase/lipase family protein [Bacteroidota bacterium]